MGETVAGESGRTALVTGASRGIGEAIALALAEVGAEVALSGRDERQLERVAGGVRERGREALVLAAELERPAEVERLASEALAWRPVDILVNCAGVSHPESAAEVTLESWRHTFDVNVRAAFFLSQRMAAEMRPRGRGRIINVTSQAAHVALPDHAAYCASKGALEMASKVMAIEWAPWGITVNCVAPTVISTPMAEKVFATPEAKERMLSQIPVGRFGTVAEVAAGVVYLASDEAAMVTGTSLRIDGGWTAR
jgi:NAD(P)-dependent dehydrogenase (short-subunit alcohol dehydrogenase family)